MTLPGYEHIPSLTPKVVAQHGTFVRMLKAHHPRSNPACAAAIAQRLGIRQPQVSALRSYCWQLGESVGSCNDGFFWAKTADEWAEVRAHIHARLAAEERNVKQVDTIAEQFKPIPEAPHERTQGDQVSRDQTRLF